MLLWVIGISSEHGYLAQCSKTSDFFLTKILTVMERFYTTEFKKHGEIVENFKLAG